MDVSAFNPVLYSPEKFLACIQTLILPPEIIPDFCTVYIPLPWKIVIFWKNLCQIGFLSIIRIMLSCRDVLCSFRYKMILLNKAGASQMTLNFSVLFIGFIYFVGVVFDILFKTFDGVFPIVSRHVEINNINIKTQLNRKINF